MPLFLCPKFPVIRACTARFVSDLFGNHIVGFLMMRLIICKMKYSKMSSSANTSRRQGFLT